jgi:tetratricopeptide (TPR) repeat protein
MVRFLLVVLFAILATSTFAQADLSELLQQALLARNVGDHDAAIHYLSLAIANGGLSRSHLGAVFASRGSAFENKGELEKAIADYSKAIELTDGDGEAYIYRGLARAKQQEYQAAISDFTAAIPDPKWGFLALSNRGNVYGVLGDHDRAIADYTSCIERNSQYSDAYYNRGLIWLAKGDSQRAVDDFRQTLAINPQDERALRALGQLQ